MPCSVFQSDSPRTVKSGGRIRRIVLQAIVASALVNSPLFSCAQAESDEIPRLERDAQSALAAQKPEVAIVAYKRILALDPTNVGAHSNLGLAYYLHSDFASAAREFNVALLGQTDQWNIIALCGISEANIGQNADAISHLERAFQHVADPELRLAAGKSLFTLQFEKGDLPRAAETVETLKQMEPENVDVLYAAHQVYSLLDSRIFIAMARIAPDSARMYQMRGDRMAHMGKIKAAIDAYRRAIDHDPNLSGVHFELAELLTASQDGSDRAQAEGEYLKELANHPQDEKSESRLAGINLQRSDLEGAMRHYQRALQLQPGDPDANEGYGLALLASDSPSQACIYLKRAVELDPNNISAHYHLSQASRRIGDLETGKREMDEFLRRKAQDERLKHSFDERPIHVERDPEKQ